MKGKKAVEEEELLYLSIHLSIYLSEEGERREDRAGGGGGIIYIYLTIYLRKVKGKKDA